MSLLATLDRLVHAARLDILTPYAARRHRNLRWVPLIVLAALVLGYAAMAASVWRAMPPRFGFGGGLLFFGGYTAAMLIRLFGPRLVPEGGTPLDEREEMIKARAGSIAGSVVTILFVGFCLYAGCAPIFHAWMPTTTLEWIYLGLGVQGVAFTLPVLAASWLQPRLDDEA